MPLGKISVDDLRLLLEIWPRNEGEIKDIQPLLAEDRHKLHPENYIKATWSHLYEFPFRVFIQQVSQAPGLGDAIQKVSQADSWIQETVHQLDVIDLELSSATISKEDATELLPTCVEGLGIPFFAYYNLRCLLVFGRFLTDLVSIVREGGVDSDKVLFNAVKIDRSVVGCPTVMGRVTQAAMENDVKFFKSLAKALTGELTKREDKTYQQMRLVLHVLSDAGAGRLSNDQLYELFVKELAIYADTAGGNPHKALRKFADQYMKL